MARIQTVRQEELVWLRQKIKARYLADQPIDRNTKWNAYLPNYESLKTHMINHIQKDHTSISNTRLRKLFYLTDTDHHGDKVQVPNFGIDFLDACYAFITDNQFNRIGYDRHQKSIKVQKIRRVSLGTAIIFVILAALYFPECSREHIGSEIQFIREDFDQVSLASLQSRGWEVLHYDPVFFAKQEQPKFFTAYTLPGDLWSKNHERSFAPNALVRILPKGNFTISLRIDQFRPFQDWQGCSLFLLDERKDLAYSIDFGYAYSSGIGGRFFDVLKLEGGVPVTNQTIWPSGPVDDMAESLEMKIVIQAQQFQYWTKVGNNWDPWYRMGEMEYGFQPAYVGIAAFQGQSNDQLQPLGADTIPVFFDYIYIDELIQ